MEMKFNIDVKVDHGEEGDWEWCLNSREYIGLLLELRDQYVDEKMGRVNIMGLSYKERERHMKSNLTKASGFEWNENQWRQLFWQNYRKENPFAPASFITKIRKKVNNLSNYLKKQREFAALGIKRNGSLMKWGIPLKFATGTFKELPNSELGFLPFAHTKTMSDLHLEEMKQLQSDLIMRIRGGAGKKKCPKKSNTGASIAYCVVTGGTHSDKESGVSGSIHINSNIVRGKNPGSDANQANFVLQCRVFCLISKVILCLYGESPWLKAVMEKLRDIPKERLIPGGRVPVSNIWFTLEPGDKVIHTDTNTLPPAFVFCLDNYDGGDLLVTGPDGHTHKIDTTAGRVIAGKWNHYPHCNDKLNSGIRHSFVCYLDHRSVSASYKNFTAENGYEMYHKVVTQYLEKEGL